MKLILALMMSLFMVNAMGQEYTSPFNHSLMAEKYYDLIVGESSGDRAFYHILDIAPYERDRKAEDYKGLFMESKYVVDKLKSYGFADATTELLGKTKTWDGVSATLWEVSPNTSKLADYRDLAAILGQGSNSAHVTTEVVWVGRGTQMEIDAENRRKHIQSLKHKMQELPYGNCLSPRHLNACLQGIIHVVEVVVTRIVGNVGQRHIGIEELHGLQSVTRQGPKDIEITFVGNQFTTCIEILGKLAVLVKILAGRQRHHEKHRCRK